MKNGKKPTLKQKKAMTANGKSHSEFLVAKVHNNVLHLVHRETGRYDKIPL